MLFNSFSYIIFLPIVVIIYFLFPRRFRHIFLLFSSLFFYSCWNIKYTLLMILSIIITYVSAIFIDKTESITKKKIAVFICFFINLSILFLFKYFNFSIDILNSIFKIFGKNTITITLNFLLPVGISFYTFQALGYTVDVYRKYIAAEKNFLKYALFVSFFPQLVAGPIERSTNLLIQLKSSHRLKYDNVKRGLYYIFFGYFLKLVIADRAAIIVNTVFDNYLSYSSYMLLLSALLFTIQIYCDFYSYSIIAKGSAKLLDINLMDNFKEPFLAKSIVEFWRRWHISLSTWFKDYLYIPLGGNKKGKYRKIINIFIIFLTSGLWHGANMTFVIWGLIHGFFNSLENILPINRTKNFFINFVKRIYTFTIVVFAFIFFRSDNLKLAISYISKIFATTDSLNNFLKELETINISRYSLYVLIVSIIVLFILDILKYNNIDIFKTLEKTPIILRYPIYLIFIFSILVFGIYGPGFSESQFIYFQF